jgi:hypothetical protein
MRRKQWKTSLLVAAVLAGVAIAWLHREPDVGAWPQYQFFRCLDCSGPASLDPAMIERWGCRRCGFASFDLPKRFRLATRADIPGEARFWDAERRAGITSVDGDGQAPVLVWSASGGGPHVPTPANVGTPDERL